MTIQLTSTAFSEGASIPKKYTCDAEDASPPLAWSGLPQGIKSLALIADDPDAPVGTWVHWVIYNIPPTLAGLPEGVAKTAAVQGIGTQGKSGFGKPGYGGPCPPRGHGPHRYTFTLYALDIASLKLKAGAGRREMEAALRGHILAQATYLGRYERK